MMPLSIGRAGWLGASGVLGPFCRGGRRARGSRGFCRDGEWRGDEGEGAKHGAGSLWNGGRSSSVVCRWISRVCRRAFRVSGEFRSCRCVALAPPRLRIPRRQPTIVSWIWRLRTLGPASVMGAFGASAQRPTAVLHERILPADHESGPLHKQSCICQCKRVQYSAAIEDKCPTWKSN